MGCNCGYNLEFGDNCEYFHVDFGVIMDTGGHVDWYAGDYEYTPMDVKQTINIKDMTARDNITINPIPSNYGKITWDGATLKVE